MVRRAFVWREEPHHHSGHRDSNGSSLFQARCRGSLGNYPFEFTHAFLLGTGLLKGCLCAEGSSGNHEMFTKGSWGPVHLLGSCV